MVAVANRLVFLKLPDAKLSVVWLIRHRLATRTLVSATSPTVTNVTILYLQPRASKCKVEVRHFDVGLVLLQSSKHSNPCTFSRFIWGVPPLPLSYSRSRSRSPCHSLSLSHCHSLSLALSLSSLPCPPACWHHQLGRERLPASPWKIERFDAVGNDGG